MKTERKRAFTVYLQEPKATEAYAKIYGKGNAGVARAGNVFLSLRAHSLRELKGLFTRLELKALVLNFESVNFEPRSACNKLVVTAQICDGEQMQGTFSNLKIDVDALKAKISALSAAQVYFLVDEIDRFWNEPVGWGSPSSDIEAFTNEMCNL